MKTFKELSIGDYIFWINKKPSQFLDKLDYYGHVRKSDIVNKTKIHSLKGKDGYVFINEGYNSYAILKLHEEYINKFVVSDDKETVYFVDEEYYNTAIRKRVLREMQKTNDEVKKSIEFGKKRIIDLRKAYYSYLN